MSDIQSDFNMSREFLINGVRCAEIRHMERTWRVGSCNPSWRGELAALEAVPSDEALASLSERGVWLCPDTEPQPLALVCCGQGAVWPHMGRELYDRLPAARDAMDRLAAIASWDILSLLDEDSVEVIGQTRWQQPYLFMLQYAQWSYFASLGIRPAMAAGHSLGEMIALCFAGAYSPETAWNMIDTRARHTADIEAASTKATGMMAVHGDEALVRELLDTYPNLYVSNYNAPAQFILSGDRGILTEARKTLRKKRVPAMLLNVTVAFHNPAMRVLHNLAIQRLRMMEIREEGPVIPVMSNTTADLYPYSRDAVCNYISVLDENSVRWTECVRGMWDRHGVRVFLETGPQDTLCSLITATEPEAICVPSVKKGKETEGIRSAVARLYALGLIPRSAYQVSGVPADTDASPNTENLTAEAPMQTPPAQPSCIHVDDDFSEKVLVMMAKTLETERAALRPEMDLRRDLGIRSSRFPLLLQDAEQQLGVSVHFSDMLNVLTVGDFIAVLYGLVHPETAAPVQNSGIRAVPDIQPVYRRRLSESENRICAAPAVLHTDSPSFCPQAGDSVLVVSQGMIPEQLFTGLAALGCSLTFVFSETIAEKKASELRRLVESFGARAEIHLSENGISKTLKQLTGSGFSPAEAVCLCSGVHELNIVQECAAAFSLRRIAMLVDTPDDEKDVRALHGEIEQLCASLNIPEIRRILLSVAEESLKGRLLRSQYAGDMLLRELLYGENATILWTREPMHDKQKTTASESAGELKYLPAGSLAEKTGMPADSSLHPMIQALPPAAGHTGQQPFEGSCHFSAFADSEMAAFAAQGTPLPPYYTMEPMLEAASRHLPWLKPSGMADIRWTAPLSLTRGITGESLVSSSASVWFRPDGHLSRFCPVTLSLRDLRPDGRRLPTYSEIASSYILLSPTEFEIRPISAEKPAYTPDADQIGRQHDLDRVFSGHALPRELCTADSFVCTKNGWSMHVPPAADGRRAPAFLPSRALNAVHMLTLAVIDDLIANSSVEVYPAGIGFIRFGTDIPEKELEVSLCCTFKAEDRFQFNAEVRCGDRIILTCTTIEYLAAQPSSVK